MNFAHRTVPAFWARFRQLIPELRTRAEKQFALLLENPSHPSVQLKKTGGFWSARVNDGYRALALREGDTFVWFWIGPHDEYERILNSRAV